MAKSNVQKRKKDDVTALFVPAGIFLGMGVGFVTGQLVGGLFIGLGLGFVVMAVARIIRKKA